MEQRDPSPSRIAGNTDTGFLKCAAMLFMIVDHVGVVFFSGVMELRLLGRIAFPLYAWCLVVGSEYTRSLWKYALRLLLVGLISQPFFMYGLGHTLMEWNIFATLFLGLAAIGGIRERKYYSQYWAPALALLISLAVKMDYGWKGILLILTLYACRNDKKALGFSFAVFCLFWGQNTGTLQTIAGWRVPAKIPYLSQSVNLTSALFRVQFFAILALPFILYPSKKRTRLPRLISYAAYPAHLLVIGLIRHFLV